MPITMAETNAIDIESGAWRNGTIAIDTTLIAQPIRIISRVRSISSSRIASTAVVSIVFGSGVPPDSDGVIDCDGDVENGAGLCSVIVGCADCGRSTTVAPLVLSSSPGAIAGVYRLRPMARFSNRVYLVTGGGRGIGRAISKRLVDDGARVCIVDPDRHAGTDAAREYGDHVLYVRGSVAAERDVRRTVGACVRWGKRLDGVVNNAGIADPEVGALEDISLATWRKYIDTNLTGTFLISKAAVTHLRRAR